MQLFHTPASLARAVGSNQEDVLKLMECGHLVPVGFAGHPDRLIPLFERSVADRYKTAVYNLAKDAGDVVIAAEEPEEWREAPVVPAAPLPGWMAQSIPLADHQSRAPEGQKCAFGPCDRTTWDETKIWCSPCWKKIPGFEKFSIRPVDEDRISEANRVLAGLS